MTVRIPAYIAFCRVFNLKKELERKIDTDFGGDVFLLRKAEEGMVGHVCFVGFRLNQSNAHQGQLIIYTTIFQFRSFLYQRKSYPLNFTG